MKNFTLSAIATMLVLPATLAGAQANGATATKSQLAHAACVTTSRTVLKVLTAKKTSTQAGSDIVILSGAGEIALPKAAQKQRGTARGEAHGVAARADATGNTSVHMTRVGTASRVTAGKQGSAATANGGKTQGTRLYPPAFQTVDSNGLSLSLSQYAGKVVVINFWASAGEPSVGTAQLLANLHNRFGERGFDVIGVSLDNDRAKFAAFVQKHNMPWRQVFGGKGLYSDLAILFGVQSVPQNILLDRDGSVVAVGLQGSALADAVQILSEK